MKSCTTLRTQSKKFHDLGALQSGARFPPSTVLLRASCLFSNEADSQAVETGLFVLAHPSRNRVRVKMVHTRTGKQIAKAPITSSRQGR